MTATIQFLSWLRRGLVRALTAPADADGVPLQPMAELEAGVTVSGTEVVRSVRVRGPGSVIGLAPQQILRRFPDEGTRQAEVNYFPAIELVSPDLPWLFTPASPTADRLMPWLALVVVEDRAGISVAARSGAPLPVLSIDDARRELPALTEAWAWAHVQASTEIPTTVDAAFAASPEAFVSRLICPRRLVADTTYTACVVPTFEPGRLAGLGLEPTDATEVTLAWTDATISIELPVYTSWRFTTSAEPADFEELVRRLRARSLGGAGVHDLDIGRPGSPRLPQAPGTIVTFAGAIVGSEAETAAWDPAHAAAFRSELREMVDAGRTRPRTDPVPYEARRDDPVIAPPSYGSGSTDEIALPPDGEWRAEANLDPVHRAAAGLGAEIVRRNQEELAADIWDQVASLRTINSALGRARLALEVGNRVKARFDRLDDGALLQVTRPVHGRIKTSAMATTLGGRLEVSALPRGLISAAFRRRARSTTIARAVVAGGTTTPLAPQLTRAFIADPEGMLAFARFTVPYGTVFADATQATPPPSVSLAHGLRRIDLQETVGLGTGGAASIIPVTRAREAPPRTARSRTRTRTTTRATRTATRAAPSVTPRILVSPTSVAIDRAEAGAIELGDAASLVREKLDPAELIGARVRSSITAPSAAWTSAVPGTMTAAPEILRPAYELLARVDPELLCPGVSEVPADTVGLALVNPAFVEAFLLGANHELSRELVWREVPVDPGDTWIRRFWSAVGDSDGDIAPIAEWTGAPLGSHRPAAAPDPAKMLVLVVKSELFRRYPTTLVYACRAGWSYDEDAQVWERVETATVEHPRFVGALGRDVVFLGFEFDAADPRAEVVGSTRPDGPTPGWFFVFEQPPTAPTFGLDVGAPGDEAHQPRRWKNVSWTHALGEQSAATHVPIAPLAGVRRQYDDQGDNTWSETWGTTAGAMARITLQRPVRMLVHGDQMIRAGDEQA